MNTNIYESVCIMLNELYHGNRLDDEVYDDLVDQLISLEYRLSDPEDLDAPFELGHIESYLKRLYP